MSRASETGGIVRLSGALDSFRCCLDEDIEIFLRQKATDYLQRGWCAIYLIVDEQEFDAGHIKIDAYFTLSHKVLIPSAASKTSIKNASGFKEAETVHFVLIGQLGKHIEKIDDTRISSADISSKEILDDAFEIIRASSALIPCRCVLVKCSDNPKVHKVYTDYHFKKFQFDGEHHQFYKQI